MLVVGFKSMSKFALIVSLWKSYSSNMGYSSSLHRRFTPYIHALVDAQDSTTILCSHRSTYPISQRSAHFRRPLQPRLLGKCKGGVKAGVAPQLTTTNSNNGCEQVVGLRSRRRLFGCLAARNDKISPLRRLANEQSVSAPGFILR